LSDLIAAKLRFKQGLMQQLLTGKRRFPEFRNSSFVEYHVGDVLKETFRPVIWNDTELYRLASIRRHSGGLFWREALRGKQIKVKKLHSLAEGDFLISHIQAAYGAMGLVPKDFADGKVSDMYTILTPKAEGTIDMRYIDYLSQMKRMRHQAYLACNGFFAERLRLNFDPAEFMKQKILLPESVKEQCRIADLLDTLVGEIRTLEKGLDALKTQKKGLMQKLLTGQVRVPASGGR
jgi:type I restriction enzyme S subunit